MKKLCVCLSIGILGLGYYVHDIRQDLWLCNWKLGICDSEHRILRDELAELRARPSYKEGCIHTILNMKFQNGYEEGALAAFENSDPSMDYTSIYHNFVKSFSANMEVQERVNKKKVTEAYHRGISDATVTKQTGLVDHPDYNPSTLRTETTNEND